MCIVKFPLCFVLKSQPSKVQYLYAAAKSRSCCEWDSS
jgi:hypothetical protein